MASAIEDIGTLTERFYSRFILRDMSYIISGLIIIVSFTFVTGLLKNVLSSLSIWAYVLLIFISYFIGLINQEANIICRFLFRMYPFCFSESGFIKQESNCIKKLIDLINDGKLNDKSYRILERIIVMKHFLACIGSATFTSGLFLLIGFINNGGLFVFKIDDSNNVDLKWWFLFIIIIIVITCLISNWRKSSIQQKILDKL